MEVTIGNGEWMAKSQERQEQGEVSSNARHWSLFTLRIKGQVTQASNVCRADYDGEALCAIIDSVGNQTE